MNSGSCPACGAALASDDRFCAVCGTDVNPPRTAGSVTGTGTDGAAEAGCASCGGVSFADGYCESCGRLRRDGRDHTEVQAGGAAAVSDRGLRHSRNEDAFALTSVEGGDGLPMVAAVVCDGVSSTHGAADASLAATRAATAVFATELRAGTDPEKATRRAVADAARAVARLAR
jgi:Double zinc ribbon